MLSSLIGGKKAHGFKNRNGMFNVYLLFIIL